MIEHLTKIAPVAVKEHPAASGRRPRAFLQRVLRIPGVHPVPVATPVSVLWPNALATIGIGSTTLLQTLAGGGAAVFLGSRPFYGQGSGSVIRVFDREEIRRAISEACAPAGTVEGDRDNIATVRRYLESTAERSLGGYKPIGERAHVGAEAVYVTDELRQHFVAARREVISQAQR